MSKSEYEGIREQRLRGEDLDRIYALFAIATEFKLIMEDEQFVNRIKTVKNGYRNARLLESLIDWLNGAIVYTIPIQKLIGIQRAIPRMKIRVIRGPLASKPKENEEEIVTCKELDCLALNAWDGVCRLCMKDSCSGCELATTLDNLVGEQRGDGMWRNIDIRKENEK